MIEYLLGGSRVPSIRKTLRDPAADLHAPALCDIEIVSALRRAIASKALTAERAQQALDDYMDLPLTRHGHQGLLTRMLELRDNFTAYDATYLALAEVLEADLLTGDKRLAKASRSHSQVNIRT